MKQIEVVAAVIVDSQNRIFATQRGAGDWKDWWEFPGGKIEPGETPEEALKREIWEELEMRITVGERLHTIEWDYPKLAFDPNCSRSGKSKQTLLSPRSTAAFHLTMHCFFCHITEGTPTLLEHEAARWLAPHELDSVQWLPADREVIKLLKQRFQTE